MADERKELDWDLSINVPVKGITRKLRVTSSDSVQAIILKVASKLGNYFMVQNTVCMLSIMYSYEVFCCIMLMGLYMYSLVVATCTCI